MKNYFGFSLLELLITCAIIAILTGIGYPLYTHHLIKARRLEAKTALLQLAQQLEHYAVVHGSYQGVTLNQLGITAVSIQGFYQLHIDSLAADYYSISASPLGAQRQDVNCGRLTFDSVGRRGFDGSGSVAKCW